MGESILASFICLFFNFKKKKQTNKQTYVRSIKTKSCYLFQSLQKRKKKHAKTKKKGKQTNKQPKFHLLVADMYLTGGSNYRSCCHFSSSGKITVQATNFKVNGNKTGERNLNFVPQLALQYYRLPPPPSAICV